MRQAYAIGSEQKSIFKMKFHSKLMLNYSVNSSLGNFMFSMFPVSPYLLGWGEKIVPWVTLRHPILIYSKLF